MALRIFCAASYASLTSLFAAESEVLCCSVDVDVGAVAELVEVVAVAVLWDC